MNRIAVRGYHRTNLSRASRTPRIRNHRYLQQIPLCTNPSVIVVGSRASERMYVSFPQRTSIVNRGHS